MFLVNSCPSLVTTSPLWGDTLLPKLDLKIEAYHSYCINFQHYYQAHNQSLKIETYYSYCINFQHSYQANNQSLKIKTYHSYCINFKHFYQAHNQSLSQITKIGLFTWRMTFQERPIKEVNYNYQA